MLQRQTQLGMSSLTEPCDLNICSDWRALRTHLKLSQKLTGEGISVEMANYLTMALDPSAGNIVELMSQEVQNYRETISKLQTELEQILAAKNVTVLDLFYRIAIRLFKRFCYSRVGTRLFQNRKCSPVILEKVIQH